MWIIILIIDDIFMLIIRRLLDDIGWSEGKSKCFGRYFDGVWIIEIFIS